MIPYQLAVFFAAIFDCCGCLTHMAPRTIAKYAFTLVSVGMILLAIVMNNEMGQYPGDSGFWCWWAWGREPW